MKILMKKQGRQQTKRQYVFVCKYQYMYSIMRQKRESRM